MNEAAERLRDTLREDDWAEGSLAMGQLDEALAAERRATVERIRAQLHGQVGQLVAGQKHVGLVIVDAILDKALATPSDKAAR